MHAGVSRHTAMPHVPSFPCDISVQRFPIDQMFISMRVPQIGWELETSRIRNDDMVRPRKFALHSMRGDRKNAVASGRSKKHASSENRVAYTKRYSSSTESKQRSGSQDMYITELVDLNTVAG